jgi:hypothetical protein
MYYKCRTGSRIGTLRRATAVRQISSVCIYAHTTAWLLRKITNTSNQLEFKLHLFLLNAVTLDT